MLNLERSLPNAEEDKIYTRSAHCSYQTHMGTIYLRDHCPADFVEQLKADTGLHTFARRPEREHELLLSIAARNDGELTLAYTGAGVIVGQITFAPAEPWWQEAGVGREVALEVSAGWRRLGIARQLIELVMTREDLEDWILLGMGFSWHWETEQLGLPRQSYRELLAHLLAPYGFDEYLTTEPNICDDPANILLVRLGERVEPSALHRFYGCLLRSGTLPF